MRSESKLAKALQVHADEENDPFGDDRKGLPAHLALSSVGVQSLVAVTGQVGAVEDSGLERLHVGAQHAVDASDLGLPKMGSSSPVGIHVDKPAEIELSEIEKFEAELAAIYHFYPFFGHLNPVLVIFTHVLVNLRLNWPPSARRLRLLKSLNCLHPGRMPPQRAFQSYHCLVQSVRRVALQAVVWAAVVLHCRHQWNTMVWNQGVLWSMTISSKTRSSLS